MQPVIQHRPPTIKLIIVRSWVRIGVSGFMGGLATRAASTLLLCKAPFRCETPFPQAASPCKPISAALPPARPLTAGRKRCLEHPSRG